MPNIFSFFSGAGFLDLGFERAGFNTVFANEIHKPFLKAFHYSRQNLNEPIYAPIFGTYENSIVDFLVGTKHEQLCEMVHEARRMTDLVGFIGGPPCPDFSIAGKNRGQHGDNGKLSLSYVQLICQQRPDFFLFENVKGLWKTKRHRDFYEELKKELQLNGYVTTERLVNSLEYGVPQDRERIILIGFQKDILPSKVSVDVLDNQIFSDGSTLPFKVTFPWKHFTTRSLNEITKVPWPQTDLFVEGSQTPIPCGVPIELTVEHWFKKNQVLEHPNGKHSFRPKAGLSKFLSVPEGDDSKKSFKRLHRWRYSPTAAYGNNEVHLHPYQARRISVAEALAIQSLPKDFCLPPDMTLSDMFKTVGNGVPFLAANAIARSIRCFLGA